VTTLSKIGFYEASAQIIPVLLIVIAVDRRAFATARNRWEAGLNYVMGIAIATEEASALLVLGGTSFGLPRWVWSIPIWAAVLLEGLLIWLIARRRAEPPDAGDSALLTG
jgi:hypothetical protein